MKENACSTQAAGFPAVLRVQTNAQKRHFCRADTNNLLLLRSSALGSGRLGFFRSCAREVLTRTLIGVDLLEILLGIPVQHTNLKPMSCCSKKPKGNVTPNRRGWNLSLASNAAARLHLMRCWLGIPNSLTSDPVLRNKSIIGRVPHGRGSHGWFCFGPKPQHAEGSKNFGKEIVKLYR